MRAQVAGPRSCATRQRSHGNGRQGQCKGSFHFFLNPCRRMQSLCSRRKQATPAAPLRRTLACLFWTQACPGPALVNRLIKDKAQPSGSRPHAGGSNLGSRTKSIHVLKFLDHSKMVNSLRRMQTSGHSEYLHGQTAGLKNRVIWAVIPARALSPQKPEPGHITWQSRKS